MARHCYNLKMDRFSQLNAQHQAIVIITVNFLLIFSYESTHFQGLVHGALTNSFGDQHPFP